MKKITVDKDACIACGACYSQATDVFTSDADGTSKVIKEYVEDDETFAIAIAEGCPTGAIKVEDASKEKDECSCNPCECKNCSCKEE